MFDQPVKVFLALNGKVAVVEHSLPGGDLQAGVCRDAEGMFAGNQNLRGSLDCG